MSIHALALALSIASTPLAPQAQEAPGAPNIEWQTRTPAPPEARPWLGVSLAGEGDLEVTEVHGDSPASAAGIRVGDRIVSVDRDRLRSYEMLAESLAGRRPGQQVRVGVIRQLEVTLSGEHAAEDGRPLLGVYLDGNQVTSVQDGHPAALAGVEDGDRILAINGKQTESFEELVAELRELGVSTVQLKVMRGLKVQLGARPGELGVPAAPPAPLPRRTPPGNLERNFFFQPDGIEPGGNARLRHELSALSEEIASLRAEIASLRKQLGAMHAGGER